MLPILLLVPIKGVTSSLGLDTVRMIGRKFSGFRNVCVFIHVLGEEIGIIFTGLER